MHFTTISRIKCDHFGTAKTPWLNAVAEWEGAPVSCLSIINLGQDALFNAGSTFDAYGSTEQDGTPVDWILVGLVSGMTQPGRSTVTSSTGACVLHFSVDVVVRDWAFPFDDTDWVYLMDDAPLADGQVIPAGTHHFEWRLEGEADLARICPAPCQINVSNMPALTFTRHAESSCTGDIDGDGIVGAADLSILLSLWGNAAVGTADLNGDGDTGAADLSLLLSNWGECA